MRTRTRAAVTALLLVAWLAGLSACGRHGPPRRLHEAPPSVEESTPAEAAATATTDDAARTATPEKAAESSE